MNARKAQRWLGAKAYRPGQRPLIEAAMSRRMALGGPDRGTSLCFSSLHFFPQAVLAVSPLISLM